MSAVIRSFQELFKRFDAVFLGGSRPDGSCPCIPADASSVARSGGHRKRRLPGERVPSPSVTTACR